MVLADGRILEQTVHGQKGSMYDPLSRAELEAKFKLLVNGLAPSDLATTIRSSLDDPAQPVTGLLDAIPSAVRTKE